MFLKKIALASLFVAINSYSEQTTSIQPILGDEQPSILTAQPCNVTNNQDAQFSVRQTENTYQTNDISAPLIEQPQTDSNSAFRGGPENKSFSNARVYNTLQTKDLYVEGNTVIGNNLKVHNDTLIAGNLIVDGTITGSTSGNVSGPGSSTINAVARFSNATGTAITDSPVLIDNAGTMSGVTNLTASGIIAAQDLSSSGTLFISAIANINSPSAVVTWPTTVGAAGTFLGSDGAGNLVYTTPGAGGDVSSAANFTTNNRVILTDTPSGLKNVKESTSVVIDASDNITGVNNITATQFNGPLNGNATTATNALNVGTQTALQVQTATIAANAATSAGTQNTIVLRDGVGNGGFSAGAITATQFNGPLHGNADTATFATTAGSAGSFTGLLGGDVTGPQGATVVGSINGGAMTSGTIITGVNLANASTPNNTFNTIVKRNNTDGGFSAGPITASLLGNASTASLATLALRSDYAWSFTGLLAGDVTGPQSATSVALVGGIAANLIASGATLANTATSDNTLDTLVRRNAIDGGFSSGPINANLLGNAATATNATFFTTSLSGDVAGGDLGSTTTVLTVGGKTRIEIAASVNDTQAASSTNTPADYGKIVRRDGSGNFSGSTITATQFVGPLSGTVTGNLIGNANTATSATSFSGSLSGDVGGTQSATVVNKVGGQLATDIANATVDVNINATDSNTPGTLVRRAPGTGNFSGGTITAVTGFTGNLTGNVFGNAATATSAVMSDTAQWFSVNLEGDVGGTQSATVVNKVGGQVALDIANATVDVNINATPNNTPGTLVKRDGSSHFSINSITLLNTPLADTDAANKAYVDSLAGGIEPKTPVVATSTTQTPTAGLQSIDGIIPPATSRVLLTNQTYQIDNGLWLVQDPGNWDRPTDFLNSTTAGQTYVLTLSGNTLAGTGWLCSTPLALIGTDTVTFVQFTSAGQTNGANVGSGIGQVFKDKTGLTLNFRTLAEGNFIDIANDTNDTGEITFAVTATSDATPNTVVSRDATGTFAGTLTGAASLNVLKAGDTMTGNLTMANGSETRWAQNAGSNYVGFKAPSSLSTFYTVALPTQAPAGGQFLRALDATSLTWTTVDAPPAATKTIYVALDGKDSNDGSFSAPLEHVSAAVTKANTLPASLSNPVTISIGAGTFIETPPINISVRGISITGSTLASTILVSNSPTTNLFNVNSADVMFSNLIMRNTAGSTATAIAITAPDFGRTRIDNVGIILFQTGIYYNGTYGLPFIYLENVQCTDTNTSLYISDAQAAIRSSLMQGASTGSPANTGMTITGTSCQVALFNTHFNNYDTGVEIKNRAHMRILACNFESNNKSIYCLEGSQSEILGSNFILNNATTVNITVSGFSAEPSTASIIGCHINGHDSNDINQGLGVLVTNQAKGFLDSCSIKNTLIGLQCGSSGDTATTNVEATALSLIDTMTDIYQYGSSTLNFVAGSFQLNKTIVNDTTNVNFAAFSALNNQSFLALGSGADISRPLYKVANGQLIRPYLSYASDYYGSKGTTYVNENNNPTFNGTQSNLNDAHYFVVTGDRTKEAGISLLSDSGNTFGIPDNIRGWALNKLGSQADLAFTFTNNDAASLALRGPYNVMQLNGLDNQIEFPIATGDTLPANNTAKLVWAGENTTTNLYRPNGTPDTLKTDAYLVVSTLSTPTGLVHSDATGLLSSSLLVNADIASNAAIADTKLATITAAGKVANSATTATSNPDPNTIVLRDGSGNFSAHAITATLTGSASLNVLKAGDTMTGNLTMASTAGTRHHINWQDSAGAFTVGLKAPSSLDSTYAIAWPSSVPASKQFLQVLNGGADTTLTWTSLSAQPAATRFIYVSTSGSDTTGDGSSASPFLTVKKAVDFATNVLLVTYTTPVVIEVSPGFYGEDNPINITVDGITIKGGSLTSTYLKPSNPSQNLFHVTTPNVEFTSFTVDATDIGDGPSDASAFDFNVTLTGYPLINAVAISQFKTGISALSSTGSPVLLINNILSNGNTTAISINGIQAVVKNSLFQGPSVLGDPATNKAIAINGAQANVALLSDFFTSFTTAVSVTNFAEVRALGGNVERTINGFQCTNNSKVQLVGLNFILNTPTSINVSVADSGTKAYLDGCLFDCEDAGGLPQGIALQITNSGEVFANACTIEKATIGIVCGAPGDTATTLLKASGISIIETATSIRQKGTSTLQFTGGSLDTLTLDIADPTNVDFAGFNANGETHLAIGKIQDVSNKIYEILNSKTGELPHLSYEPNYYGYKGTVYHDPNNNPTFNGTQAGLNNARYFVITEDNTKEAGISLISDTVMTGSPDNVRGWSMTKLGTSGDLAFSYTNNDGLPANWRGPNTIMQLNGETNEIDFPLALNAPVGTTAKLVWGGEPSTNLYRPTGTPNTLKTDANFVVGDALTAGSTFITTLTLTAGTSANPSLQFAGSTNTGLSAQTANRLSFDTNGVERMSISSTGTISINEFTTAGIVHNNAAGQLASSLIVNADISASANIVDTKLATISTAGKVLDSATTATSFDIVNTIVKRDSLGNFAATVITARLTGTASENILRSGDSMTGTFTVIAGSPANPSLQFAGSTNTGFSAQTANRLSFGTNGVERASLDATAFIAQVPIQEPYGSATAPAYTFSGDINTGIYDKAADTLGFATNGVERMTIESTGTVNVLGTLVLAAGTAAQPSLKFTNGTNTGFSSPTANKISFDTNGVERMSIMPTGTIIFNNLICNQAIQIVPIGTNSITVNNTTSVIVKKYTGNTTFTIDPAQPTDGQLLTIIAAPTASANLTIVITGATFATVNGAISPLNPGSNPNATANGMSVTYIYSAADNIWYRYWRG